MDDYPIFVGYDGSEGSRTAVRWALDEGARRRLPVRLIHVVEFPWRLPSKSAMAADTAGAGLIADAESVLEKVAVDAAATAWAAVEVTSHVLAGPISGTLCEESGRASMVVLGSRGTGGFVGLPVGSVSVAVATHARCPVVVVRDGVPPSANQPIVVGVDESEEARLAIEFAFEEAAARRVGLVAVRAWRLPSGPGGSDRWPPGLGTDEVELAERNLASAMLEEPGKRYPSVEVSVHAIPATTVHALEIASRDAQLLVVGCRGGGGFHGLLLGSVSLQVLHHARCSVAVLRQYLPSPAAAPGAAAEAGHHGR
jgi:nucleotide-binding universal stress UspA family protein